MATTIRTRLKRIGINIVASPNPNSVRFYDPTTETIYVISPLKGWVLRQTDAGNMYQLNRRVFLPKNSEYTAFTQASVKTIQFETLIQILIRSVKIYRRNRKKLQSAINKTPTYRRTNSA